MKFHYESRLFFRNEPKTKIFEIIVNNVYIKNLEILNDEKKTNITIVTSFTKAIKSKRLRLNSKHWKLTQYLQYLPKSSRYDFVVN